MSTDKFEKLLHARSGMAFFLVTILALLVAFKTTAAVEEFKTLATVAVTWMYAKATD